LSPVQLAPHPAPVHPLAQSVPSHSIPQSTDSGKSAWNTRSSEYPYDAKRPVGSTMEVCSTNPGCFGSQSSLYLALGFLSSSQPEGLTASSSWDPHCEAHTAPLHRAPQFTPWHSRAHWSPMQSVAQPSPLHSTADARMCVRVVGGVIAWCEQMAILTRLTNNGRRRICHIRYGSGMTYRRNCCLRNRWHSFRFRKTLQMQRCACVLFVALSHGVNKWPY
jgi:hypothetical protein